MKTLIKLLGGAGSFLTGFVKNKQGTENILLAVAIAVLTRYIAGLFGWEIPLDVAVSFGIVISAIGKD
jgi:hypothetical protein